MKIFYVLITVGNFLSYKRSCSPQGVREICLFFSFFIPVVGMFIGSE